MKKETEIACNYTGSVSQCNMEAREKGISITVQPKSDDLYRYYIVVSFKYVVGVLCSTPGVLLC